MRAHSLKSVLAASVLKNMDSAFRRINHQGQKLGKPFALSTGSRVLRPLNSVIRLLATEAWIQLPDVSHGKPLYLTTTQGNSKGSTLGVPEICSTNLVVFPPCKQFGSSHVQMPK